MYSIDISLEQGLKTGTLACREVRGGAGMGMEVVVVDVGEITSPPGCFGGAWGGRGYSNHTCSSTIVNANSK